MAGRGTRSRAARSREERERFGNGTCGRGEGAMNGARAYASPQSLRQAVTDRLREIATPRGLWTLGELQRQFAYDRLLTLQYVIDDGWVLKGAVALLARQVSVRD